MDPKPFKNPLARWLWLGASVSAAFALSCMVFSCQYYQTYGQWPRADGRPDATEVHFPLLDETVMGLLMVQFMTVPVCLVLLVAIYHSKVPVRLGVRLYAWAAMLAAAMTMLGGFMSWYFD